MRQRARLQLAPTSHSGAPPPPTGDAPQAMLDGAARVDLNHKFACARCLRPQLQLQQVHSLLVVAVGVGVAVAIVVVAVRRGSWLGWGWGWGCAAYPVATPTHDLSGSLICSTACPQPDCILSHKLKPDQLHFC